MTIDCQPLAVRPKNVCVANEFIGTGKMKIKVESEKIIKAVKKLDGIEIVLENLDDAREAINLILLRAGLFEKHKDAEPKEVRVSSYQKYETTAVDYKMIFLLEFIFKNDVSLDTRVVVIKELQEFFSKV
jgi:copper chaperone CopZ